MPREIVDEVKSFEGDWTDKLEISSNLPGDNFPSLFIELKQSEKGPHDKMVFGLCDREEGVRMIEHMAKMLGYSVELTDTWKGGDDV